MTEEILENQTMKQKKIALAQSEFAPVVIEIIRDCAQKVPLLGKTEFETLVNAITMETTSTLMRDVVGYLDDIRNGKLHNVK
jgi:hypothetical protein